MPGADNALAFVGEWEDAKGQHVCIEGTKLSLPDGSVLDLSIVTRTKCAFKKGARVCLGTLNDDKSKLVWNDGTSWDRKSVPLLPASVAGSKGPARPIRPRKPVNGQQGNYGPPLVSSRGAVESPTPLEEARRFLGGAPPVPLELGLPEPGGRVHEEHIDEGAAQVRHDRGLEPLGDPDLAAADAAPGHEEGISVEEEPSESSDPAELLALSRRHLREGRGDKALRTATDAWTILKERGDIVGEVDAVHAVITGMAATGEVEQALKMGTEAATRVRMSNEPSLAGLRRLEAPIMLAMADVHLVKKNHQKALESAKKALSYFQGVGDKRWTTDVHLTMSGAHLLAKDFEAALKSAETAKRLYEESGSTEGQAIAMHRIVDIHLKACKYNDAARSADAARLLFQDMGKVDMEACMLQLAAQAHLSSRNHQKALAVATEAVELNRVAGKRKEEGIAMMSVVRAHLAGGAPGYAAGLAEDVLSIFRELGEGKLEADMQLEVARMHKETGQLENAMESASVAQTIYAELNDQSGKKAVNELLCLLELMPGMKERALGSVERLAQALKDRDGRMFHKLLQDVQREERAGSILAEDVDSALQPLIRQDPEGAEKFILANTDGLQGEPPSSLAPGLFDRKVQRPTRLVRERRGFGARGLFDGPLATR